LTDSATSTQSLADDKAVERAETRASEYLLIEDKIRQRADIAAKALGALGTTTLTTIGLAKIGDVFPWPGTGRAWWALVAVVGGYLAIGAGIGWFTYKLWSVNDPIRTQTDLERMQAELRNPEERAIVERVYRDMSILNAVPSLAAYEARAHRFDRISELADPESEVAKRLRLQVDRIHAEVLAIFSRVRVLILRRRANRAFAGPMAWAAYAFILTGTLAFLVGSDYLQSERADKIDLAQKCQKAAADDHVDTADLPRICLSARPQPVPTPTPALAPRQQLAKDLADMVQNLVACEKQSRVTKQEAASCKAIRNAIAATASSP